MLAVPAVGLALVDFKFRGGTWDHVVPVLAMAISAALVAGVLMQARDLRRLLSDRDLSTDARFGIRFAVAWRIAIVCVLAGYHVLEHFSSEQLYYYDYFEMYLYVAILYHLALVVIVSNCRQLRSRGTTRGRSVLRYTLVWILGGCWVSIAVFDLVTSPFLVQVAIAGIELSHSPVLVPFMEGLSPLPVTRAEPVFWLGVAAAALVPPAYILIYFLARNWNRPLRRRRIRTLFAAVFSCMTAGLLWNVFVGLQAASPWLFSGVTEGGGWNFLFVVAPCFLVLVTAAAYRWTAETVSSEATHAITVVDRRPYLHERRWLFALLVAYITYQVASTITYQFTSSIAGFLNNSSFRPTLFINLFAPAALACWILLIHATFARWRERHALTSPAPLNLPPRRFAVVWILLAATTLVALPVLAIYGFALWMAPWYLSDWYLWLL